MVRTTSLAIALLAVVASAGWLFVGSTGQARADGIYNPNNIEHTYSPYYPGYTGPCNDGIDNDYDGFVDALDSDCLDAKPATSTATVAPTATNTPPPAATATSTPHPPSLGGVAAYPHMPSGADAHTIAGLSLALVALVVGGAGWFAWRRTPR